MAKGYWMARVTVKDPERYKDYVAANKAPLEKYGAKFIVRGGNYEVVKGTSRERHVILEFDFRRRGLRMDCILLAEGVLFVIEFKRTFMVYKRGKVPK